MEWTYIEGCMREEYELQVGVFTLVVYTPAVMGRVYWSMRAGDWSISNGYTNDVATAQAAAIAALDEMLAEAVAKREELCGNQSRH